MLNPFFLFSILILFFLWSQIFKLEKKDLQQRRHTINDRLTESKRSLPFDPIKVKSFNPPFFPHSPQPLPSSRILYRIKDLSLHRSKIWISLIVKLEGGFDSRGGIVLPLGESKFPLLNKSRLIQTTDFEPISQNRIIFNQNINTGIFRAKYT